MNLKNYLYLTEKKDKDAKSKKVAFFTFGRFQPPTKGHKKIIDAVNKEAQKIQGAKAMIYLSQTHDKKGKNPLEWKDKIVMMKKLIPNANIIADADIKTAWNVIEKLDAEGYTELYLVCGSDRVEEYTKRWLPYAKKVFQDAEIINAGMRDPDVEGSVVGMSGTKAREAAAAGNIGKFRAATGWSGELGEQLMHLVKQGLPGGDK